MAKETRTQDIVLKTGKKKKYLAGITVAVAIVAAIIIFFIGKNGGEYVPPAFDDSAVEGIPEPDDSFMYSTINSAFGYTLYMAANTYQQENQSMKVYFTNPKDSGVYAQVEFTEAETGKILYKSGIVRPGEYVESLKPYSEFGNVAMNADVHVYAYEVETWYSAGNTELGVVIQPW